MRRFRRRRMRLGAIALASLAAVTTTTITGAAERAGKASIDSSSRSVPYGEKITLRGSFPDAPKARVVIRHRAKGSQNWNPWTETRTGAGGRWSVRVAPRRSGYWRAELDGRVKTQGAAEDGMIGGDPAATPAAGTSSGAERIGVRSRTKATVAGRHTKVGRKVHVRGRVLPAGEQRRVLVEIGNRELGTRAGRDGRFDVTWKPRSTGTYAVRVKARGNRLASGSKDSAGKVTAYRPASASWYGPGLYGNKMACGGTLTPSTLGVAHKTMPCGTKLRLRYGKRTVAVRVVDRGPFSGNREFDLTSATKQRLGFPDLGTVWSSK